MTILWMAGVFNGYAVSFYLKHTPGNLGTTQIVSNVGSFFVCFIPIIFLRCLSAKQLSGAIFGL